MTKIILNIQILFNKKDKNIYEYVQSLYKHFTCENKYKRNYIVIFFTISTIVYKHFTNILHLKVDTEMNVEYISFAPLNKMRTIKILYTIHTKT